MKKVVVLLCLAFACILALDSIVLTGVARDVFPCSGDAQKYKCGQNYGNGIPTPAVNVCRLCQPEFQSTNAWQKDIVKKDLDANRKPVFNNTAYRSSFSATNGSLFYTWYNNDANYNFPINVNLTFTNTDSQPNVYSMYSENFFPVDNQGFGNYADNTVPRNYHFTFELKSRFFYRGNETFSFSGDDDVWVFINNKLAIDLGGVHGEQTANLILNQSATLLGITPNNTYNFDFFFAERHTWSSRCKISTSLELTCANDWCGVCQGDGQSCCKANDNNACTVDTCNPTTGAPIYTPVTTCTGSNRCLNYLCNQTATVTPGCYTTPVTCQPLNACYTASCSTSVGCQNTLKNCDDGDACTTDACDATLGCTHTPIVCDDKNGCTNDTCSKDNGCSYVPISCDDKNACTSDSCDVNGVFPACSNLPVNINDDDECTIDSCNSVTGVAHNPLNCNDNNACTADSCDSSVGCQNVNVTCNDGDGCTTDSCSKDSGCSFKPYTCNDNDACTVDSCNSSAPYPGCSFKSVNPDDGDLCTTDSCNKITGVSHVPVNCDDGNACTQDACNSTVGCYYETVTCDDQDECTIDSCSNSTGCVFEKKNCDDKDDCTIDECDSNHPGGCKNTRISPCLYCSPPTGEKPTCPPSPDACHPIVCDNAAEDCVFKNVTCDDKNACTSDSCKDVNGIAVCQFTPITDSRNTACTPYTCNPQTGVFTAATAPCANKNPCLKGSCAVSSNNTANCTFTAVECETIDVCSPASCSLSNGSCITTAIDCNDGNECTRDYCKKVGDAAQCFNDYIPADDEDACHPYSCDSKTGVHTALELPCVDGNLCTDDSCALNGTSYSCTFSAIECKATNACVPQVCDSGKCVVVPVVCNDGNPCTNDSAIINANGQCECVFTSYECPSTDACFPATCNVTTGKCDVAPVVCDDHNVCTNDTCVAGNCSYKAYECNDGNECTTDTCVAANNVGCTFTKITCDDKNACTTDTCNPLVGCQFTTSNLSDPGVCKTSYCDNNLGVVVQDQVCRPADRCSCVDNKCQCQSFLQQYETQAKITGGVIAGIIIGVVAFVVLAALGGKKGYDFYKASKDPALAVEDNPLYEGSNKDVENPLYESNKE